MTISSIGNIGAKPVRTRLAGTLMRLAMTTGVLLAGCKETGSRCLPLADEGNFAAAHACYNNVLKSSPGDAEVWHNAGLLLAIEAVKLKPGFAEAWYNLGLNYQHYQGNTAKALECLDRATRLKPDYLLAWKNKCLFLSMSEGIMSEGTFISEGTFRPKRPFRPGSTAFIIERTAQMEECQEKLRQLTRP
jgi:tetratricopeptide (TPR) repeat protein